MTDEDRDILGMLLRDIAALAPCVDINDTHAPYSLASIPAPILTRVLPRILRRAAKLARNTGDISSKQLALMAAVEEKLSTPAGKVVRS